MRENINARRLLLLCLGMPKRKGKFDLDCDDLFCASFNRVSFLQEDHAICCVSMGLGMIETMKIFDAERHAGIKMRVGIHTGEFLWPNRDENVRK
jgi:Adenylate and Guanylate cyclase catalytic domain